MATETTPPANPAAMEDILTSIRTGVAEETAKVGSGSDDLINAAAAQDNEDDVLELSPADMVEAPGKESEKAEELIDIATFAASGESKPVEGEKAAALAAEGLGEVPQEASEGATPEGAADEFDRLLAEISQEQQQQVAASEVTKQTLMEEEEPLGGGDSSATEAHVANDMTQQVEAAAMASISANGSTFKLSSVEGPEGVQIAFPAEVLAMALRPMVQEWLAKNLPGVVEKLVQAEISKLSQN